MTAGPEIAGRAGRRSSISQRERCTSRSVGHWSSYRCWSASCSSLVLEARCILRVLHKRAKTIKDNALEPGCDTTAPSAGTCLAESNCPHHHFRLIIRRSQHYTEIHDLSSNIHHDPLIDTCSRPADAHFRGQAGPVSPFLRLMRCAAPQRMCDAPPSLVQTPPAYALGIHPFGGQFSSMTRRWCLSVCLCDTGARSLHQGAVQRLCMCKIGRCGGAAAR